MPSNKYSQRKVYSKKEMYSQWNSVGTDKENIFPGNLRIIWKLNDVWPLKKNSVIFLRLLKFLKLKKNSISALRLLKFLILKKGLRHFLPTFKVVNAEKGLHHFFTALKVFNTEKGLHDFLTILKVFNIEKGLHHFLMTLKFLILKIGCMTFLRLLKFFSSSRLLKVSILKNDNFLKVVQNSSSAEWWWTAPANIRLDEDVFRLQDEYIPFTHTSSEDVFKMTWSRPI